MQHLPGDPLSLNAALQNRVEASVRERETGATRSENHVRAPLGTLIRVKNTSATDMERFAIAAITSPVIDPDSTTQGQRDPTMGVDAPAWPSVLGTFCVLQEAIAAGKLGFAIFSGVAVANVNHIQAADRCAAPDPVDPTRLRTCDTGEVKLVGTGGSGVSKRLVMIGHQASVHWGYKRNQYYPDKEVELYRMDDSAAFAAGGAGIVDLQDDRGFMDEQAVDSVGVCVQIVNKFYAIQAVCGA